MLRTLAGASRAAYFLRATRCATFVRPQSTERETNHGTLLELDHVVLSYPNSTKTTLGPLNFTIVHPSSGGHALFGKNGSGKSLLAYTLASLEKENRQESKYLRSGSYSTEDRWHSRAIAKVSFQSHEELLKQGGTVSKAISDGGNLSKAAKFLIVRFGIYHLLYRQVETLSTGEIRKVLLIRALANRPRLLILDNSFDGLDAETRHILKNMVSRTIQGFRPDILVQAVSAKATAHTQVLLLTNRAEEIVDEIEHVSIIQNNTLVTRPRQGRTGEELMQSGLGLTGTQIVDSVFGERSCIPSQEEIRRLWGALPTDQGAVIQANGLQLVKGDATILKNFDWVVERGERWLIAGRNGAGKSSLSRLLAKHDQSIPGDLLSVAVGKADCPTGKRREGIGWCSTELHLSLALEKSGETVKSMFEREQVSVNVAESVLTWLGFDATNTLSQFFSDLSQGQQKLVLIATAIACRPPILVLDEITQGLDIVNRSRVLGLVDLICQATDVTLIYITHHMEELLPSITHVLHIANGEPIFVGSRQDYDADAVKTFDQTN